MIEAGRITLVESSHDTEQQGCIRARTRNDAGLIEARCECDHAVARYASISRFQADGTRQGRRLADRTAGIRACRCRREACRDRGGRTARRAARRAFEIPGIFDGSEVARLVRRTHRELVHIGLAEYNGTRASQSFDDGRIVGRDEVLEHSRTTGGEHVPGTENVFMNQRQSIQYASLAGHPCLVGAFRGGKRALGRNRDKCIEGCVVAVDAAEKILGQLNRRKIAPLETCRKFCQGLCVQVPAHHSRTFGTR